MLLSFSAVQEFSMSSVKTYTIDTKLSDTSMLLLTEYLNLVSDTVKHEQSVQISIARLIVIAKKLNHNTQELCMNRGIVLSKLDETAIEKVECPTTGKEVSASVQQRYDKIMLKLDEALMSKYKAMIYPEINKG